MKSEKIASALDVPIPSDYQIFVNDFAPVVLRSLDPPGLHVVLLDVEDSDHIDGIITSTIGNRSIDVPHDFLQISCSPWGGFWMLDTGEGSEGEVRLWDSLYEGQDPETWPIIAGSFTEFLERLLAEEVPLDPMAPESKRDLEKILRRLKRPGG